MWHRRRSSLNIIEASARQYGAYAKLGCYPMDVPNLRPLLAKMTVPVLFCHRQRE